MDWLWFIALGLGAGSYGVIVGAGGGFIIVPVLLLFFGYDPAIAAGTSLALVVVNSLSGSMVYRRAGLVDRRSAILFAAAALPGSVLAPLLLEAVTGAAFSVAFGALLLGLAGYTALRPVQKEAAPGAGRAAKSAWLRVRMRRFESGEGEQFDYSFSETMAVFTNVALGFVSSFFGVGGGFLRTPLLIAFFDFPVKVAAATSIYALAFYTFAGAATHALLSNVEWYPAFVWIGAGLVLGGQVGARAGARLRSAWIVRLLVLVLGVLGVQLIVEASLG